MKPTYPSNEHQQATSDRHAKRRGSNPMTQGEVETIAAAQWKRDRKAAKLLSNGCTK